MKNQIKTISLIVFTAMVFMACNNQPSIQEYYVEKQQNDNFIAIDLPASLLKMDENASAETKETMATIKKLNVLAFRINETNKEDFDSEYTQVKAILKGKKYNELMRMKHENINIIINYEGKEDAVDEFILFASDKDQGFALARILGDKMQPEKMIKIANDFKNIDKDDAAFAQLAEIFSEIKVN
jgi:hypothetical protein